MPQPCTYSSAQEAGQREHGRRICQRNGHQLLKATVAGDDVDIYDERDTLWRFQEAHTAMAYDKPYQLPIAETVYDLQNNRYLVQALNNEDPETVTTEFEDSYFAPGNVKKQAR